MKKLLFLSIALLSTAYLNAMDPFSHNPTIITPEHLPASLHGTVISGSVVLPAKEMIPLLKNNVLRAKNALINIQTHIQQMQNAFSQTQQALSALEKNESGSKQVLQKEISSYKQKLQTEERAINGYQDSSKKALQAFYQAQKELEQAEKDVAVNKSDLPNK